MASLFRIPERVTRTKRRRDSEASVKSPNDVRQHKKQTTEHIKFDPTATLKGLLPIVTGPLTPEDSDDEHAGGNRQMWQHQDQPWRERRPSLCSISSSIRVNMDEMEVRDVGHSPVVDSRLPAKIVTSFATERLVGFLMTPPEQRVPTPTMTRFGSIESALYSTKRRSWQSNTVSTMLSPVPTDSPIDRPSGLMSPRNSPSVEMMEALNSASDCFSGLRVDSPMTDVSTIDAMDRRWLSPSKARLHMGFKADCEKCISRVPGHYSHIIRT